MMALLAAAMLCLSACGRKPEPAPELLEPISTNQAYRPVVYGDIGNKVIKTGTIVPTDYCHFFQSSGNVKEIYVNIGEYVTAGTVLAEIDTGELGESIDSMKADLENRKAAQEINQKIFDETQKKYDYRIRACEEFGDAEGAEALRLEKATNAENNRYDTMLFNHQISKTEEELAEKEALQSDTTLVARHSGYVTYVKDITYETSMSANENIVIISDYEQPYIEITGEQVGKRDAYSIFKVMYTVIEGERYEIETYNYSNEELAAALSASALPYVRFRLKDGDKSLLTVGNKLPLYFTTSDITNTLIIGEDSLYTEGDETFVYVKTENNDMEKREIVIGERDNNYIQVLEGLSEGELVSYFSDSLVPSSYTEYTASLGDFEQLISSDDTKNTMEDTHMVSYYAPCDGYFKEFLISKDQWVNKGDLLYVIDSGGGSAELKQLDIDIANAKESYNSSIADLDDQMKELDSQIEGYKTGRLPEKAPEPDPDIASGGDADTDREPEENTLYMAEQLTCDKQILVYNKELTTLNYNSQMSSMNARREELSKNNDGYGNISVYAENDGYVKNVDAYSGYKATIGDRVATVGAEESMILAVTVKENKEKIAINQSVVLTNNADASIKLSGKCIGQSGDSSKSYITTLEDGEIYVTRTGASDGLIKYYVEVDDKSFYDDPKGYSARFAPSSLKQVVMIPPNMVYHEKRMEDGKEFDYVWKITDGELVKQYVTLGPNYDRSVCILSGLSQGDILAREDAE